MYGKLIYTKLHLLIWRRWYFL